MTKIIKQLFEWFSANKLTVNLIKHATQSSEVSIKEDLRFSHLQVHILYTINCYFS